MSTTCKIRGCKNRAAIRTLCKPCYSAMYYWSKKTPTQIMHRQEKLRLYDNRMAQMTGVHSINTGRRKKRRTA